MAVESVDPEMTEQNTFNVEAFSATLYERMQRINPGVADLALYEFRYGLNSISPEHGWASAEVEPAADIERRIADRTFYDGIQLKPKVDGRIVLDEQVLRLTRMLLVGLFAGVYSEGWINRNFYFDIRGFYFLHRTTYFTDPVLTHFGGAPFRQFEQKQKRFERFQGVGYKDFMAANTEVDALFIESARKLIAAKGLPTLLAIAGPTAAGKTEIVERLQESLEREGRRIATIELDNFLTDREAREAKGIFTLGKEAFHFALLNQSLEDICNGRKISIPRYDFVLATSSHDDDGVLKPDGVPIEIDPADIIFMEGNFPFLFPELAHLIQVKVVYLTDDPVRLKRKWKRDIDYRKKYEPTYFRNRYFKDQFIMAEVAYRPQLEVCDLCVDTTGATLWATPETAVILAGADSVKNHLAY
jgi:uridine kinase